MTAIPILGNAFLDIHSFRHHKVKAKISEGYWNIVEQGPSNGKVFAGKVADAVQEMTEGAKFLGLAILTYIDLGQSPRQILAFFVNAKTSMSERKQTFGICYKQWFAPCMSAEACVEA